MKTKARFVLPLPGCSAQESRIVRQVINWADDYKKLKAVGTPEHVPPSTTATCSKHFQLPHGEMMSILSKLEKQGLLIKRQRLSAGLTGNGFAGALYAEVVPTEKARQLVASVKGRSTFF